MLSFKKVMNEDEDFLFHLYVSTRQDEFTHLGWSEKELEALLRMQYEAQKASYRSQIPAANHQITVYEHVPIGRIITAISEQAVGLVDISLLPEYRGRGFGTVLLQQVQRQAAEQGLPVKLHVLNGNPAQRLYARCGFYVTEESAPYIAMQWDAVLETE